MHRFRTLGLVLVGYSLFFLFTFRPLAPFLLFFLGLMIGYTFHIVDRFCQIILVEDFKEEKTRFFSLMKTKKMKSALFFLIEKIPSVTHSFYFVLLYFPLALYVTTSTGSVIGTGIMLGLGLAYSVHFILGYKNIEHVRQLFFKPLKKSVTNNDVKKLMGGFIIAFSLLSLFVLF